MADSLPSEASDSLAKIRELLKAYSRGRQSTMVGQFLDAEGRDHPQCGVYGMSAWLLMTQGMDELSDVSKRRGDCADALAAWTAGKSIDGCPDGDGAEELVRVIPKIAYALDALNSIGTKQEAVAALRGRLEMAQSSADGSWSFVTSQKGGSPLATAIVVRSLDKHINLNGMTTRALEYLRNEVSGLNNQYERLFVLNVIYSCHLSDHSAAAEAKKFARPIKTTIREIYRQIRSDPTSFTNPMNIDFNDNGRTRYFRMPTDLLLLESLCLISGPRLLYLRAHVGKRLLKRLIKNLDTGQFNKDLSQHRASIGVYHMAQNVLRRVSHASATQAPRWLLTFFAAVAAAASFGVSFTFNSIAVLSTAVAGSVALRLEKPVLAALLFGVMARTLTDALRSLWSTYWGRDAA